MACSWTWNRSTPSIYQKWSLDFKTPNLMYRNTNCDPVTERLTPITIGKFMLLDQSLIFLKPNLIQLASKFIFVKEME